MYKAIIFDIGRTLIGYNKPLNWSSLYRPALEHISNVCNYQFTEKQHQAAMDVLTKYNTRVNPREYEVSSTTIFSEITSALGVSKDELEKVKHLFYSFFRRESFVYPEVEYTLAELSKRGILIGTLSDVAYGMDNKYVLDDISSLKQYIDFPYTSNDVGFRKPNITGVKLLSDKMKVEVSEIIFVGDEEKDMICANHSGAYSVLINRDAQHKEYGQQKEIKSLAELLYIID